MNTSSSKDRLVKNEAIFRQINEEVQNGLNELEKIAGEDGQSSMVAKHDDVPLHFYCECADITCHERIEMNLSEYKVLHYDRRQFIIKPGHEIDEIEDIVDEDKDVTVVKKRQLVPELTDQ